MIGFVDLLHLQFAYSFRSRGCRVYIIKKSPGLLKLGAGSHKRRNIIYNL